MEQGWDPDIKKFFLKVLNSLFWGLLWLMATTTAGLYYGLAFSNGQPLIYIILFYTGMLITLLLLLRYYFRTWKN